MPLQALLPSPHDHSPAASNERRQSAGGGDGGCVPRNRVGRAA